MIASWLILVGLAGIAVAVGVALLVFVILNLTGKPNQKSDGVK